MSYAKITNFGRGKNKVNLFSPLTYTAVPTGVSMFNHTLGNTYDSDSVNGQRFLANYCSSGWDEICKAKALDTDRAQPISIAEDVIATCMNMTKGEQLIANTASVKYLSSMSSNCRAVYTPFDPTVATSPLIREWESLDGRACVPVYTVDPAIIDNDEVMDSIIAKPGIWINGLINIYRNARVNNTLSSLVNTKLYRFVFNQDWFKYLEQKKVWNK